MDQPNLLPLILIIMGSCFRVESLSPCSENQFLQHDGICCEFCPIGTFMLKRCQVRGSNPLCAPCEMGKSYMDNQNHNMTKCRQCSVCDPETEVEERECTLENNRQCVCREGFHRNENKCVMEESTARKIYFPSNKSPSWWISSPMLIAFVLLALCTLFWGKY
uniref:TNFR-Cys domain-containing protein n=1 Tax=Eptatretus burgeri TaxID=7764 RepID=A0A8C4WVK7_EPTBU